MKLLIITQSVDRDDPVMGFFHRWIEEFSKNFESLVVICLWKGSYDLPKNVKVLSLGKEEDKSKVEYIRRFYKYIWEERENYDSIFVHMNQEYVLLAGVLWRLMDRKVYLWRNHAKGNLLTKLAIYLSHKVFYTSPRSFTARFSKSVRMPIGVDMDSFKPDPKVERKPGSILFLGRIAPVKKVLEFVEWLSHQEFKVVTIAGSALPKDFKYEQEVKDKVKQLGLEHKVKFIGSVTQKEAKNLYQSHELYANFTPAGSMDKTIVEALSCGMELEVRNPDATNLKVEDHNLRFLARRLAMEIK